MIADKSTPFTPIDTMGMEDAPSHVYSTCKKLDPSHLVSVAPPLSNSLHAMALAMQHVHGKPTWRANPGQRNESTGNAGAV